MKSLLKRSQKGSKVKSRTHAHAPLALAASLICDGVGPQHFHGRSLSAADATIPMPEFPISEILAVAGCWRGDNGASELVGRFISLSTDPITSLNL